MYTKQKRVWNYRSYRTEQTSCFLSQAFFSLLLFTIVADCEVNISTRREDRLFQIYRVRSLVIKELRNDCLEKYVSPENEILREIQTVFTLIQKFWRHVMLLARYGH